MNHITLLLVESLKYFETCPSVIQTQEHGLLCVVRKVRGQSLCL